MKKKKSSTGRSIARFDRTDRDDVGMVSLMLGAAKIGQLDNLIAASTPGGIERQEKMGQLKQESSETLPRKMGYDMTFYGVADTPEQARIGTGTPTMEYLDDEKKFKDGIYVFHIHKLP